MKTLIPIITFFILLSACSKEGHIDIKLTDKHLEEIPAGNWLKIFNLDYHSGEEIKVQISKKLRTEGELFDETIHKENSNDVRTYIWDFKGVKIKEQYYTGGIWGGPKVISYQEYYNAGTNIWITIIFKEAKLYSDLLPDHYNNINPNRKYEHTATIESRKDSGRRLFLFGYGKYCERISLF